MYNRYCLFVHYYIIKPCIVVHNLLFDFFWAEVKVAVADPLDLKPVPEVVVSTALKRHLQTVDVLLLEAATRGVRVLVEADAIPQADLKRRLQTALHGKAHDDRKQHEDSKETRNGKVWLQEGLPARKPASVQGILADLWCKVVDTQGGQTNYHEGIGHNMDVRVIHHL